MKEPPFHVILLQIFQKKWEEHYQRNWRPMSYQYKQAWDAVTVPEGFDPYTLDDFSERISIYFSRTDDWIVGSRHNFSVFCKHFEKWVPERKLQTKKANSTWHCPACGARDNISTHKCRPVEMPKELQQMFTAKAVEANPYLCPHCKQIHSNNFVCKESQ